MATIKKGILGGFSGKVGTVIGGNWRGVDYIRSLPKRSSKPASQEQIDQRLRFTKVMNFVKPISGLIGLGYQAVSGARTPLNAAVSYLIKQAITGSSPNFALNMAKIVFSQGDLLGPWVPKVIQGTGESLDFSWTDNSGSGLAAADDLAIILVYNEVKSQFVVLENAAERSEERVNLILPDTFMGDKLNCWMSFVTSNGKKVSTSVYVGELTIQ